MSAATAALPAYSGPDGTCPRCGVAGAMTEWHWAAPLAPTEMAGRQPPCAEAGGLAVLDGRGEHLCRLCMNCGYGWTEACTRPAAPAPNERPVPPAVSTGLLSLAACVVSTGAGCFLSPLLAGAALVAGWLAVTVAVCVAAGCAAAAARDRNRQCR